VIEVWILTIHDLYVIFRKALKLKN
jgi:hypothetical protein